MTKKIFYTFFTGLLMVFLLFIGCRKEYSFEGADTTIDTDTTSGGGSPPAPWICPDCVGNDAQLMWRWSFHAGNTIPCGVIDTAIINQERTAFTFFGPYSCSGDTGIIVSAHFIGKVLDRDLYNINTQNGAFYFYDNIGPSHVYISSSGNFTVKLDSYIHQTRLATGTFSGPVTKPDGSGTVISSGKFKVKL